MYLVVTGVPVFAVLSYKQSVPSLSLLSVGRRYQWRGRRWQELRQNYSETAQTDHLYRSTSSRYGLAFLVTEIKSAVSFPGCGKFYKSTTSLNGPDEFSPVSGRLTEVVLYLLYGWLRSFDSELAAVPAAVLARYRSRHRSADW